MTGLPISSAISRAYSTFFAPSTRATSRKRAARSAKVRSRQPRKACQACASTRSSVAGVASSNDSSTSPLDGLIDESAMFSLYAHAVSMYRWSPAST